VGVNKTLLEAAALIVDQKKKKRGARKGMNIEHLFAKMEVNLRKGLITISFKTTEGGGKSITEKKGCVLHRRADVGSHGGAGEVREGKKGFARLN